MLATHQMDQLPLLFNFQDLVAGKGFIAGVATRGRVLMKEEEEGQIWMYGVEPGGIAASGSTCEAALQDFRNGFRHVLIEIAAEAGTFDSFKQLVQKFFREVDQSELEEWQAAHAAVRSKSDTCGSWFDSCRLQKHASANISRNISSQADGGSQMASDLTCHV